MLIALMFFRSRRVSRYTPLKGIALYRGIAEIVSRIAVFLSIKNVCVCVCCEVLRGVGVDGAGGNLPFLFAFLRFSPLFVGMSPFSSLLCVFLPFSSLFCALS